MSESTSKSQLVLAVCAVITLMILIQTEYCSTPKTASDPSVHQLPSDLSDTSTTLDTSTRSNSLPSKDKKESKDEPIPQTPDQEPPVAKAAASPPQYKKANIKANPTFISLQQLNQLKTMIPMLSEQIHDLYIDLKHTGEIEAVRDGSNAFTFKGGILKVCISQKNEDCCQTLGSIPIIRERGNRKAIVEEEKEEYIKAFVEQQLSLLAQKIEACL